MKLRFRSALACALLTLPLIFAACEEPAQQVEATAEGISLLGDPLIPPVDSAEDRADKLARLKAAQADYATNPDDLEAAIWVGRRLGYLYRYREAIDVYTKALEKHPDHPKLLRHRGHRYLTLRQFSKAIRDLSRAAEVMDGQEDEIEPDGIPNARNEPRTTLKFNIWYHLGLAYFCNGEYSQAYSAFGECYSLSKANGDSFVACTHWLYVATRAIKLDADAEMLLEPITLELDVIENKDYLDLIMLYKGHFTPEEALQGETPLARATRGFGVAHFLKANGDADAANDLYLKIVSEGPWPSFGALAAEAELSRL